MGPLLIILLLTMALAVRAAASTGRWGLAESEPAHETGVVEACARSLMLVLVSLLGLLALKA